METYTRKVSCKNCGKIKLTQPLKHTELRRDRPAAEGVYHRGVKRLKDGSTQTSR